MASHHISHFVPWMFWYEAEDNTPGPNVSGYRLRQVEEILDSEFNTSITTARFNQSTIKRWENEMREHWDEYDGTIEESALSDGARRRYCEIQNAWRDIRDDLYEVCPAQTEKLDRFLNCTKYGQYA